MDSDETIGDRIRAARGDADLTQYELARVLDVRPLRISLWERQRAKPNHDGMRRLREWKPNLF